MYASCLCTTHTQGGRIEALLFNTIGRLQARYTHTLGVLGAVSAQQSQVCKIVVSYKERTNSSYTIVQRSLGSDFTLLLLCELMWQLQLVAVQCITLAIADCCIFCCDCCTLTGSLTAKLCIQGGICPQTTCGTGTTTLHCCL
jgi:hypothetical protein